jgi:hypothetical protein
MSYTLVPTYSGVRTSCGPDIDIPVPYPVAQYKNRPLNQPLNQHVSSLVVGPLYALLL